jgi:hypothetical protein
MPAVTVDLVIAVVVIVLCVLGAVGVLPASPLLLFVLIGATAASRLV